MYESDNIQESLHSDSWDDSHHAERPIRYPLRPGVRVALDFGKTRVGIAKTDSEGIMAQPVATALRGKNDITILMRIVHQYHPLEIYVGYPLLMDGTPGLIARRAARWALKISAKVHPIPVRMIDERLTSVMGHRQLHEVGRKEIAHRSVIDQLAAVNILESALDNERITGSAPGIDVKQLNLHAGGGA